MFVEAMEDNVAQIRQSVGALSHASTALDLGCWDGATARRYLPDGVKVTGVERNGEAASAARAQLGWTMVEADLNTPLPLDDATFDLVTSNQVIEHLFDTDTFVREAFRVLRPGGVAAISTENLASWHNIAALLLGWQAFSLTNVSDMKAGLGNPLANTRLDEPPVEGWTHHRLFSYRGLAELFEAAGFTGVKVVGAGYYPLPTRFARFDPRHAAFITVVGTKPAS